MVAARLYGPNNRHAAKAQRNIGMFMQDIFNFPIGPCEDRN
jgi:hypothetical protein